MRKTTDIVISGGGVAGLTASAVALLTDPAGDAYEALGASEKGKVRMLRMPAETIWSATDWAEAAGVAMTPIATPCSWTIAVSSPKLRIFNPATSSPWRLLSASRSATVRKPREENPE